MNVEDRPVDVGMGKGFEQTCKMAIAGRMQVFHKTVTSSLLDLANVKRTTQRAMNAVDEVGRGRCETVPDLKRLVRPLDDVEGEVYGQVLHLIWLQGKMTNDRE